MSNLGFQIKSTWITNMSAKNCRGLFKREGPAGRPDVYTEARPCIMYMDSTNCVLQSLATYLTNSKMLKMRLWAISEQTGKLQIQVVVQTWFLLKLLEKNNRTGTGVPKIVAAFLRGKDQLADRMFTLRPGHVLCIWIPPIVFYNRLQHIWLTQKCWKWDYEQYQSKQVNYKSR